MKGSITQRGPRRWKLKYDIGADPVTGKRRQRYSTVHGTKHDAHRELRRILASLDDNRYIEPARQTVAEWLRRWLDEYVAHNVSAKTAERYREIVEKHLIPALGAVELRKLMPVMIAEAQTKALTQGRRVRPGRGDNAPKGLSPQTVRHHHRVLHQALKYAVRLQVLGRNPAEAVDPPKVPHREMEAFTIGELSALLRSFEASRLRPPVLLAATTGMRRGEVLGLCWSDVDLDNGRLTVRQVIEQTADGVRFKEPKTRGSRRTITLPEITVEALKTHRAAQAAERLAQGLGAAALVFTRWDGAPLKPSNFSKSFSRHVAGVADVRSLSFHALRHTHLSHLMAAGVPVKVVSERAGHASAKMTLDIYGHVMPGMQEDVARQVDASMRAMLKE